MRRSHHPGVLANGNSVAHTTARTGHLRRRGERRTPPSHGCHNPAAYTARLAKSAPTSLIGELQSEGYALNPGVRSSQAECRLIGAGRLIGRRETIGVDRQIHLVAGTRDAIEQERRVAHADSQVGSDLPAGAESHLRKSDELVAVVGANI